MGLRAKLGLEAAKILDSGAEFLEAFRNRFMDGATHLFGRGVGMGECRVQGEACVGSRAVGLAGRRVESMWRCFQTGAHAQG